MPASTNGSTQDEDLRSEVRDLSRRVGTVEVRLEGVQRTMDALARYL